MFQDWPRWFFNCLSFCIIHANVCLYSKAQFTFFLQPHGDWMAIPLGRDRHPREDGPRDELGKALGIRVREGP